jgi:acylphosphatase
MTVHLMIKGKVQGVFYRVSAKQFADELGLKGWIQNTDEGHVESIISGDDNLIKQFIEWSQKGPRNAKVLEVIVNEIEEKVFDDFIIAC